MSIGFLKASACGNDFLIIDGALAPPDIASFTRRICDRHHGIGADGVEWLYPASEVAIEARLINADGSSAEISGNGTRCVAASLCFEEPGEIFVIRTGAGDKVCRLTSRNDSHYEFETAMGTPTVDRERATQLPGTPFPGVPVLMGNPHFVVFVEMFSAGWQNQAVQIQKEASFPHGVNVEFVRVHDPHHIEVRFFERGVGETLSSGTGSSAAAAAAIATGRCVSSVRVEAPGGSQFVRWEDQIYLRGSADLICRGEFFE